MKMTHYYCTKSHKLTAFLLLMSCVLTSCMQNKNEMDEIGKGIKNPIPSENPISLTAEAQTKEIDVKNLAGFSLENPKTDKTYKNEAGHSVLESDWVTFTFIPLKTLQITVKENTTNESRTHNLLLNGIPGGANLIIIQNGKTN